MTRQDRLILSTALVLAGLTLAVFLLIAWAS